MRLYLLPLSTRRTFLYAQRLHITTTRTDASYIDRGAAWAARKWSQWEKQESGWQKKVVEYGNHAFRRIPYEEWGLKSVPALSSRRRKEEIEGAEQVEVVFPRGVLGSGEQDERVIDTVRRLGVEREGLHRRRLMWCFVGMPITAPFALVPVIPNLPFFYLVYRAWSHWRAISGGKHIQWLVEKKLLKPTPSPILDALYSQAAVKAKLQRQQPSGVDKETLLLTQEQVRTFSESLDVPALEIELERAIWQVEQAIQKSDGAGAEAEAEAAKDGIEAQKSGKQEPKHKMTEKEMGSDGKEKKL
ncbi:hypothetical protein QQS21_006975 [Conoideocrella luteorostrata]|uniref:Mitochondrial K+-H+ exchange-related-domain-containing protein n=1 Tax=Conoideocrella luteorostrata TaxID=1105319 RepID=A0AAJ0FXH3_9HYPO|nr:hypothetical protein QQS21_006975 [Conoideocrella luteorostrata]